MYSFYHTDGQARIAGERIVVWKVNSDIKSVIEKSRLMMIEEIIKWEIHIECNPTSNIRIGGIRRYDRHPILKFHNEIIYESLSSVLHIDDKLMMSFYVNTDDKGVFDTSLERGIIDGKGCG